MVTHEADVARHAKRIIRMKDGRVLSDLPTEQDITASTAQSETVMPATLAYATKGM
jgi:ABC-type lipoprotein export system ATPase subunit